MQERLDRIGARVAAVSDRQDIIYRFKVVDNKELNAFALPGGFLYVHNSLMRSANDDELACVLAHEIGHVAARHSVKRLQSVLGYQLLSGIVFGVAGRAALHQAMDVVHELISLGYSRKDELAADDLAVRYSSRAGFNPMGMATFLEKLKGAASAGVPMPAFLSSHPAIDERIARVKAQISSGTALP
jgi:predicted Zn-dependent protease